MRRHYLIIDERLKGNIRVNDDDNSSNNNKVTFLLSLYHVLALVTR